MASTKEKQIVDFCIHEIRRRGGYAVKIHGNMYMRQGTPDIIGVLNGRALAIEAKQVGKNLTPVQRVELGRWAEGGAVTAVIRTREDVAATLDLC